MYKAIIIEDEQKAADMLEGMLKETSPAISIVEKCPDLPSGVRSIKKHRPYIVFLDIELPVYSGIQLLDFFDAEDVDFKIIFTTAYNQYALRAFEMSAIDYLLKPIQESQLQAAIAKTFKIYGSGPLNQLPVFKQNFIEEANKKMVLPVANGYEIFNLKDIIYLKAEGSYTQIISINDSVLASKNLKHFQFILEGASNFFRIHRSIIVNIHYSKKLLRDDTAFLILENGSKLPVANDRVDDLLKVLRDV
ncbi:MAG: LytTR family DNA-binding domain-containing protein [Bacteroidota bacterium]|nr:LytTR family DNA-binding domain-containing protein [Bacteroidota bacterium]